MFFWDGDAKGKGEERHIFLFEKGIVNTKREEEGRKCIFKNLFKVRSGLSDMNL